MAKKSMISKATHKADAKRYKQREEAFESEASEVAKHGKRLGTHYPEHMEARITKHKKK